MLWFLLGCPKRTPDIGEQIEALLARSDAAFEDRAEGGFDPVRVPLVEAYGLDVDHPGVAWRFARMQIAQGLSEPDSAAARALFAEGRASADRCLRADPQYLSRRQGQGLGEALAIVEPERRPCVAYLALAWVRWSIAVGPAAAALDLESIDLLLGAAASYEERSLRGTVSWAWGLSLATRPEPLGRDLVRAQALLDEAIREGRGEIVREVDKNRYVLAALSGEEAAADAQRILSLRVKNPEDQLAISQLRGSR